MSISERIKQTLINLLKKDIKNLKKMVDLSFKLISDIGYVIPMAFRQAVIFGNIIVDNIPYRSSADHSTNLKQLLIFINNSFELSENGDKLFYPYFDFHIVIDPIVEEIYNNIQTILYLKNFLISIEEGFWGIKCKDRSLIIYLFEHIRRSALDLLSDKVNYLYENDQTKKSFSQGLENVDSILLTQHLGIKELDPIIKGTPDAWNNLLNMLNINIEHFTEFITFIEYLKNYEYSIWYQKEDIWNSWRDYIEKYSREGILKESFMKILDFFSANYKDILNWGISIPFIKIGQWYGKWPFYHHVLHPNLSFLSILIRKYNSEWSKTVGSELAKVSNYIVSLLPTIENIFLTTLKKKKDIGDIDLAIYNLKSNHLIICEIKTVFDRFRTNYQLKNYITQRVNFEKANNQLNKIEDAIITNNWTLREIFGRNFTNPPKIITKIILTWWDVMNINLGTSKEDILCCNFKIFQYLYTKAKGDLGLLATTIYQMSKIYCFAYLKRIKIPDSSKSTIKLQIQSDILPPLSYFVFKNISTLALAELKTLQHLQENFKIEKIYDSDVEDIYFYNIPNFDNNL